MGGAARAAPARGGQRRAPHPHPAGPRLHDRPRWAAAGLPDRAGGPTTNQWGDTAGRRRQAAGYHPADRNACRRAAGATPPDRPADLADRVGVARDPAGSARACARLRQPLCSDLAPGGGPGAGRPALAHPRPECAQGRPHGRAGAGLDWGVNTLLTGTVGKLADTPTGTRVVTDGRMLRFSATGISAKLHRLRGNREQVAARRDNYARLLGGLPEDAPGRMTLTAKHALLVVEHQRVCVRIRRLNHALAWAAARWAVDQASALGASVIFVEDLATLEARRRRKGNARLSGQVRGRVVEAIRYLAARAGIATVTVPARGTSKLCPRCGAVLLHTPAPDRTRERGWKWATCPGCGLASDRDHAAAERILARGLLAQAYVQTDPKTGQHDTVTTVDGNVARARRPKRRTRAARRFGRPQAERGPVATATLAKHRPTSIRPMSQASRRVPDRRAVPAPAAPVAGKRPAGQVPQTRHCRAVAGSGPARDLLRCLGPRRPGNGWGFHRNVTATPILRLGAFGPATTRPRSAQSA